jgi:hypothetical protein
MTPAGCLFRDLERESTRIGTAHFAWKGSSLQPLENQTMYLSLMIRLVFTQLMTVWMSAMLLALCIVGDAPAKEFTNTQIEKLIEQLVVQRGFR